MDRQGRGGGLLILISTAFCHRASISFTLSTSDCEILAVDLYLPNTAPLSVINAYFPSGVISTRPLDAALASCKPHSVLAGDFNSHHVSWDFRTDACGRRLWEWIGDNNMRCYNSGAATCVRGQSRSALDLTLSKSGLVVNWETISDATNSDHVPVLFEILCPVRTPSRKIHAFVNMNRFAKELRVALSTMAQGDEEHTAAEVLKSINDAAVSFKFSVSVTRDTISPWWNEECTYAHRRRNAAWKRLLRNQCPANWSSFKFIRAIFKRTINKAKKEYKSRRFALLSDPRKKRNLFRFLRSWNVAPPEQNIESVISSPDEIQDFINQIAQGLHARFTSALPPVLTRLCQDNFEEVTLQEIGEGLRRVSDAAPGPACSTSPPTHC